MLLIIGAQSLVGTCSRRTPARDGSRRSRKLPRVSLSRSMPIGLLQREIEQRLEFVERKKYGELSLPAIVLIAAIDVAHSFQSRGGCAKPALASRVGAIEKQARVDIPRHAVQRAVDDIGVPDSGEVIGSFDDVGFVDALLQRFERADGHEFRNPRVAELRHVRQRVARECGEQFFVRGGQRNLLRC